MTNPAVKAGRWRYRFASRGRMTRAGSFLRPPFVIRHSSFVITRRCSVPTVLHDGLEIAYWRVGTGVPIVWIQGLNADHSAWLSQVIAFQDSYDCIALDNRDVGQSGRATGDYTLAEMAGDVRAVLDHAGVDDAHVVGLS